MLLGKKRMVIEIGSSQRKIRGGRRDEQNERDLFQNRKYKDVLFFSG